ncbi:hypothetical protein [Desulfuribacillus alkaliarsenatis]|uniref:Uncharacterized protein n=1 Tax=Desulfuribacillus alkaliarsenatis TaxID=766136 RepID=A0A1E5G225_9FIRM|nr:hypothetical protein [Desulfuribacillus alkaliarsenatis]OEF97038.1 hypothetical protein BHF68_05415 [Desulfuribacillus alkaliarsenatis]
MESINNKRFDRLRKVVEKLKDRELTYELDVLNRFDILDMEGIEKLSRERQLKQELRKQLELFIAKYEHKNKSL